MTDAENKNKKILSLIARFSIVTQMGTNGRSIGSRFWNQLLKRYVNALEFGKKVGKIR